MWFSRALCSPLTSTVDEQDVGWPQPRSINGGKGESSSTPVPLSFSIAISLLPEPPKIQHHTPPKRRWVFLSTSSDVFVKIPNFMWTFHFFSNSCLRQIPLNSSWLSENVLLTFLSRGIKFWTFCKLFGFLKTRIIWPFVNFGWTFDQHLLEFFPEFSNPICPPFLLNLHQHLFFLCARLLATLICWPVLDILLSFHQHFFCTFFHAFFFHFLPNASLILLTPFCQPVRQFF